MTNRWYPSKQQLNSPEAVERAFRQLLDQHYRLQDAHIALQLRVNAPVTTPPTKSLQGPTNTVLLGLNVAPVDAQALADGAKLTWVKSAGNFQFK